MKSNLFKQLEQLKTTQTARDLKKNRYASILFPFQQASALDRDTIKSIASQGFANLIVHDPTLQNLRERLFNPDMDGLQREQLTATQNQEISEFIQEAIRELAPYFLLEDCQKVFEYLLRNFEVHNYEADTLIVALMPYHSTVFYVKLLQNIDLKKTTHWVFMEKNVKEGLVIPRSLIARQCVLDGTILDLITRNIIKMVESKATQGSSDVFFNVGGASSSLKTTQQKNIEVSFGMLVSVEIIVFAKEKKKLNENLLMTLMRFLSFCLKSSNNEVFRAGLVVILQLTSSASVSSQYIQAIVLDVSRKISEKSLLKDILLLYVYVHQISENIAMPIEVFRELVDQLDHALPILVDISETYSIANLVLAFYRHVCNYSNYQDEDLMSNLVRATARLLQRVVDTEPHLQESFKRLHLTKLLVQEIFDTLATKTKVGTEEDKFVVISYLASLLTEVKNLLPDQATEALKEIVQNGEGLGDFSKQVKRLLTSTFSRLYIEGVLGVEVSEESGMETEYKQLLPSISPYHPISTAQKLKALERVEELVESGSMEVEGEDSLQATLSNIVLSHFRTHSYNEKVLASLLKSQRIQSLIDIETFVKHLIDFLAKYYKTPANKEISEAVKLIYTVVIERYSELSGETAQEVKEFLVETLFSQRATVLRESLKNLKTILPTYFKPIKPTFLDLGSARKVKEGILDSFAKAIGIDGLAELEDEYKRAKSLKFKELIRLLQLSALEGVATILPNVPEYVFGLLRSLREFTPTRVNEFVTRVGKIAEAINGMEKNKRLDSKPQIINLAIESIYFLVSLQDTNAVSVLKEFIELFGEDKLTYLLLLGHQIAKKNQDKQFMIVSLFIHNILSSENFEQKNFFHEILLVLPFLEAESRQIKLQALSILSKISQKFKKQTSDSIVISGYGDFYIGNILNDNLFEIQLMAFDEQITIPSAPFNKFIKNVLKHENELAGSSTSKAFSHILEKLGTSFTDYEWLFRFIIGNLFALPVRSLFNLALEIFSFISGKFHQEVVQREEIRHLLTNLEKVLLSGHQAASVSHQREIELVGNILQKSGKIYTDSDSTTLVNDYFNKVYTKIAKLCNNNESPLAYAVLNSFGKTNYILLAHENQLELLELMFSVTAQGVSMSTVLTSLTEVDPTDDILIMFGENMLENFNVDSHLIERLTFLAELFIYLNRKSLKYLPLLNQIYQHVLTKAQEDVISFIEQIRYALSLFVGLHRQILASTIDSKASIDYSKTTPVVHKKSKSSIPIKNIAGDFVESSDSYIFIASLNDLASLLLNKDNGALLEDTTMFALVKELFGCLTTYTAFLSSSTSHILVKLLAPLFKSIEAKGPKMQVYTLRLFGHILNLAHTTLRTHFDIHPYIKLFLRVLSLKGKVASQTAGLAKNANYDVNEVEREIGTIIKTIGQKNLDYIVYGMISNLMKRVATDAKEKVQRKQVVAHDAEINSAINIVFSSERLEDSVNVLSKIISSTYNVCAYYLSRVLELDKKKKKILVKTGSTAKGKKLVSNYSLLKLQTQRSFLSISLYFGEKSLQSNEFMTAFSNYLIKGNFQPEVIEEFANLITSLAELKHLISQGLSKLQTGKLLKHTKATGTNTTLKKKVKTKTFLKNTSVLVEKLLGGLQELIPEELLTLTCCRILEREPTLRIKSKVLQIFSDKLASIGSPRLTVKSLGKFRGLVEASLVDNKEQLLDSKSLETSNYLQSVFMSLSTILKKKPKVFEDGLNDNVFDYVKHSVFPVRCSVFYMLSLFSEKFSNKAIANLPTISVELLWTVLTCIKHTEQQSFEVIAQIAAEKNLKVLGEIATRGQSDDDEVPQSPEGCFILCINSLILLLKTYKDMMNPYVLSIILIFSCLSADQPRVEELLNFVNTHIEARNLIEPLSIAGDVQHRFSPIFGKRIAKLVGNACEKMEADTFESKNQTLFKLFLRVFDYARNVSEVKEGPLTEEENQNVEEVQSVWTDSFCRFALKTNEVQLKKYFLKLNEWSSKIMSEEERMFSLSRKIIVYQLVTKLFDTLRGFFVSYMAFFFDFCIDQLVHYAQTYKTVQKTSRRKKQEGDMTKIWEVKLHNLVLQTLQKCFAYDKENDFIDSSKFDKIIDPLVDQLDCIGIPVKYDDFIDNSVQPAIIELFELVKDDYKWKSLNYALLMKTRSEVSTIRLAAIKILLRVIEQLKERTAVLIQDILPFLSETLEDEDIQVEKISKEIVVRLEQITGENIKEYLKS